MSRGRSLDSWSRHDEVWVTYLNTLLIFSGPARTKLCTFDFPQAVDIEYTSSFDTVLCPCNLSAILIPCWKRILRQLLLLMNKSMWLISNDPHENKGSWNTNMPLWFSASIKYATLPKENCDQVLFFISDIDKFLFSLPQISTHLKRKISHLCFIYYNRHMEIEQFRYFLIQSRQTHKNS